MRMISGTGGASVAGAPNLTYETQGFTGGVATAVVSGAANAKGNWTQLGAATAATWMSFTVNGVAPSAGSRVLADFGIGPNAGAVVTVCDNVLIYNGTAASFPLRLPIIIPAGSILWVRTQTTAVGQSYPMFVRGAVKSALSFPGFAAGVALDPDLTNSRPSLVDVALDGVYVTLGTVPPSGYGAAVLILTNGVAAPTSSQIGSGQIAIGEPGAEVVLMDFVTRITTGSGGTPNHIFNLDRPFAAGIKIRARLVAPTVVDLFRFGTVGFRN